MSLKSSQSHKSVKPSKVPETRRDLSVKSSKAPKSVQSSQSHKSVKSSKAPKTRRDLSVK